MTGFYLLGQSKVLLNSLTCTRLIGLQAGVRGGLCDVGIGSGIELGSQDLMLEYNLI